MYWHFFMRNFRDYKICPLGESAITIDFGNEISFELNDLVLSLSREIEQNKFEGFIECVPAYSSLTVFYDVLQVRKKSPKFQTAFDAVKFFAENKLKKLPQTKENTGNTTKMPVSFRREFALDLEFVAETNNLKPQEVVEIFLSKTYRVFMLGFLPGFAYMGELDERIATPRKGTPRTKVPKGSVGIAGRQTGIYPLESPGGWQIIGKTDVELFTPDKQRPTLFQTGDIVKFTKIK